MEGETIDEAAEIRTKWTEFQSHASFAEEQTQIDSEVLETRMGELQCKRYTVTDGPTTDVYWFAVDKPGMPVKGGDDLAGRCRLSDDDDQRQSLSRESQVASRESRVARRETRDARLRDASCMDPALPSTMERERR